MQYEQRRYARLKFLELMAELNETTFEAFFHRLMCARYPEFLDVRTHGQLPDLLVRVEPRVVVQQRQRARVTLHHLRRGEPSGLGHDQTPVFVVGAPHHVTHI
jgi:hypothetical protein